MKSKFIETRHQDGPGNWGKFMIMQFTEEEWKRKSSIAPEFGSLLSQRGWTANHFIAFDIETGEGGIFKHGGLSSADLNKHKIWVCPMFEPFLTWLYKQDISDLDKLPSIIDLPNAPFAMQGYRRPGTVTNKKKQ